MIKFPKKIKKNFFKSPKKCLKILKTFKKYIKNQKKFF